MARMQILRVSVRNFKVNNLAIEGKPDDLVINTHVCRGNYHSAYFSSGAYDPVAEKLFGEENVNAYYLEFDDERSGGFEPLKYVSGDKRLFSVLSQQSHLFLRISRL